MSKKQFSIETELTAKIDDLTAKLNTANTRINRFKQQAKKGNDNLFSGIGKSLGGLLPTIGVAATALTVFQGAITTTQTLGDAWNVTLSTAKGALEGFFRTLAEGGNFDNLIDNISKSSKAAKDFAIAMDEIFEKTLSSNIKNSEIDIQLAEANKALKLAKAKGDSAEVLVQAAKINKLEDDKLQNSLDVAQSTKEAFINKMQEITGLDENAIIGFIKTYSDEEIEKLRELANEYNNIDTSQNKQGRKAAEAAKQRKALLEKEYGDKLVIYAATLKAYNSLNDEMIKGAVDAQVQINNLTAQRIKNTDKVDVAATTAEKTTNKPIIIKAPVVVKPISIDFDKEFSEITKEVESLEEPLEINYVGLPKLKQELSELQKLQQLSPDEEAYKRYSDLIKTKEIEIENFTGKVIESNESLQDYFNSLGSAFNSMGQSMRSFGADGLGGFMDMIAAVLQFMSAIESLSSTMQAMSATKQATDQIEMANSTRKISLNSGEAITEATKSGAKMPFPLNLIAIASGVAAVVAALASISQFETGGIVGGTSFTGDNVLARVNSGEMILNKSQQANLFKMINNGSNTGSVEFEIKGDRLVGVLNNYGKRIKSYK